MRVVRREQESDYSDVAELVKNVFTDSEFGHNGEAELVSKLRAIPEAVSLVSLQGSSLVGHVLFSPVRLVIGNEEQVGFGLGPMAVEVSLQRKGIGSEMVTAGLQMLFGSGAPFVVVLGHPEYYTRFGFRPAADFAIEHGFEGLPQDCFFICWAKNGLEDANSQPSSSGGRIYYDPAFGAQHVG